MTSNMLGSAKGLEKLSPALLGAVGYLSPSQDSAQGWGELRVAGAFVQKGEGPWPSLELA